MDPLTHLTSGGLGSRALRERFPGRTLPWIAVTAAVLPDIDNFVGFGNPERYMIYHRGITHSFAGGLLLAVLLAAAFSLFRRSVRFRHAALLAYAFILVHILLDLCTSYGTQVLSPFTNRRYTLNCLFIVDPIFLAALVSLWGIPRLWRRHARGFALAGLVVVLAYPLASLGIRLGLERYLDGRLRSQGLAYDRLDLSPEGLAPFYWKVILSDGPDYRIAGLELLRPSAPLRFEAFKKADPALMSRLGQHVSFFNTFAWFAAYPVMEAHETATGSRVTFGDLRFYSTLRFLQNAMGGRSSPFSLTAVLDSHKKLVGYEYGRGGGAALTQRVEE